MIEGADMLRWAAEAAIALLLVAMLLVLVRLVRGPNLGDRIMALDTLTMLAVGLIGALTVRTGLALYLDIAIAIALVGFLSTVALARYLLMRALKGEAG
jgi:multicomponent Na+:H+ antiporter subunit F